MSFRVDLEMATQGLRVGVRVKASSLEKARVPAGTVRLLELFFRGSVSVRAELRNEFPFVTTVSCAWLACRMSCPPEILEEFKSCRRYYRPLSVRRRGEWCFISFTPRPLSRTTASPGPHFFPTSAGVYEFGRT